MDFNFSSSSTPVKPFELSEADENDRKFPKNQNTKKPPHFMSPTISATSKAAISRKKILTERNESSDSETHPQINTSNFVPGASPIHLHNSSNRTLSRKASSEGRFYGSDDGEHNDSSSKPYDPFTNYLSPRPKYLQYNSKRRRTILSERETESENDVEGTDGQNTSDSYLGSSDEIENEENNVVDKDDDQSLEEDEEEIEDFEDEGGFSWTAVFKFLLVAAAVALLTWCIPIMNSSEPWSTMHPGSADSYIKGYHPMYDIVDGTSNGEELVQNIDEKRKRNNFYGQVLDEERKGNLETEKDATDDGLSDSELETNVDGSVALKQEAENINDENFETEMDGHATDGGLSGSELETNVDGSVALKQEAENINDANFETEMDGHDQARVIEIITSAENPKKQEHQLPTASDKEKGFDISEVKDDKSELLQEDQRPLISDLEDMYFSGNEETVGELVTIEGFSVEGDRKVKEEERSFELFGTKHSISNLIYGTLIGLFMIIASSILAFYSKFKKAPVQNSLVKKPPLQNTYLTENISSKDPILHNSSLTENISSKDPIFPNLEKAHVKTVESYVNSSSFFQLGKEELNEYHLTHAPEVELLGEFVVGDVWSSMKNCSMKNKTKELEVTSKDKEFKGEATATFQDKVVDRKAHLSLPDFSASSVIGSSSYGSYTDEKRVVKKEEGSVTTTPVRRSSRLRNRVMSP